MPTIAEEVESILDARVHEQLCACIGFPGNCVTYGLTTPWNHCDVEEIVKLTVKIQEQRAKLALNEDERSKLAEMQYIIARHRVGENRPNVRSAEDVILSEKLWNAGFKR